MKSYAINNKELITILDKWMSFFLSQDRSGFTRKHRASKFEGEITPESVTGEQYLKYMQSKPQGAPPHGVDGFPEDTYGTDLMHEHPANYRQALQTLDRELLTFFGGRNNAVKMYYPKGGYMGWHHNANASGLNILLSWSAGGTGYFRYQDPVTKEIVTMHDTPGWTCKAGYYGSWNEKDKVYWHCASAHQEERLTLAYIVPHEGLWTNMLESIVEDF